MKTIEQALSKVVDEYRRRLGQGAVELLRQVDGQLAISMGKMLRPRLVLLSTAILDENLVNDRRTILLATAAEMLHNASLLHDDVVDGSAERRGLPSVNSRWDNRTAILTGDYHLAQVMQIMEEVGDRNATQKLIETVIAMTTAELLQIENHNNVSEMGTYSRITCGKTARLMATCCAFGNPELEQFGLHYGMAFQLRDDIDDNESTPFTAQMLENEIKLAKNELADKENSIFVQELHNMTDKLVK